MENSYFATLWGGRGGVVYIIMFYINLLQIHKCCHICSPLNAVYLCKPMSMQCDFFFHAALSDVHGFSDL
jgi:hypothetical protein